MSILGFSPLLFFLEALPTGMLLHRLWEPEADLRMRKIGRPKAVLVYISHACRIKHNREQ